MPSRNPSGPSKGRGGSSRRSNSASGSDNSGKSDKRPFRKSPGDGDRNEKRSGPPRRFNDAGGSGNSGKSSSRPYRKSSGDGDRNEKRSGPPRRYNDASGSGSSGQSSSRPFRKSSGEGDRNEKRSGPPRRRFSDAGGSSSSGKSGARPFRKSSGDGDRNEKRSGPPRRYNDASSSEGGKSESRPFKSSSQRPRKDFGGKPFSKEGSKPFKRPFKGDRAEGEKRSEAPYSSRAGSPKRNRRDDEQHSNESPRPRFEKQHPRKKADAKTVSTEGKKFEEGNSSVGKIRLNKFIANSGVCSRREADQLITIGLITVNGVTITELGHKVNPGDEVRHDGKLLHAEKHVYILMNKPKGFLTTTADPQERNTVMHLVGNFVKERVYPVGRLDRNTTGLLLLTNDGDLAEKLMHPSYNVKKIYKVDLDRPLTKGDAQKIIDGVRLEEGVALVDDLAIISDDKKTVGLEIHIGWNRVVRRIFEALEYAVIKLDRTSYAGLTKKELGRGEWRFLKKEELVVLKHLQ